MPTRQYIGARYVPKIFDNNGSSEWISGIAYEALTIVTYLNNSFTSKKPVPSSVGNPADNSEYWVNSGDFSGAISSLTDIVNDTKEELENEMGAIDDKIVLLSRAVNGKKILIIGDSVSDPNFAAIQPNWADHFEEVMTELGATVVNNSASSRCIVSGLPDSVGGINDILSSITDTYDTIIVELGVNDWSRGATTAQIQTAIANFATWLITHQQTAKVYWVTPLSPYENDKTKMPCLVVRNTILKMCAMYKFYPIDMYALSQDYAGNNSTLRTRWTLNGDSYHPLPTYAVLYANLIIESVLFGTSVSYNLDLSTYTTNINCLSELLVTGDGRIIINDNTGSYTPTTTQVLLGTLPEWAKPKRTIMYKVFAHANFDIIIQPTGAVYGLFAAANVEVKDITWTLEFTPSCMLSLTN